MMKEVDLVAFGQILRKLRKIDGYTQEKLAELVVSLYSETNPDLDLRLDGGRISKWERAYVYDKEERTYRPTREQMLCLIELFAAQMTLETARDWAAQAGYPLAWHELEAIFTRAKRDSPAPGSPQPPPPGLFGIATKFEELQTLLAEPRDCWLVAICGLGGVGKTTMAEALVEALKPSGRFQTTAWVSAKQEHFMPYGGWKESGKPALDEEGLVNALLEQLSEQPNPARSLADKIATLTERVKAKPILLVVDNLETAVDYETLLPLLRRLSNPSKVLLTSRMRLHGQEGVRTVDLDELAESDALDFLRYESRQRGLSFIAEAETAHLGAIYQTVGGNPLALKLVIGQLVVLPLDQVLTRLREAQGQEVDEFYTYIYWEAWRALDETGRQTLLAMPLMAQGGAFDHLLAVSELAVEPLRAALAELIKRSLVEVRGSIIERRYAIHRLTETFLLNEVLKWSPPL